MYNAISSNDDNSISFPLFLSPSLLLSASEPSFFSISDDRLTKKEQRARIISSEKLDRKCDEIVKCCTFASQSMSKEHQPVFQVFKFRAASFKRPERRFPLPRAAWISQGVTFIQSNLQNLRFKLAHAADDH